MARPRKISAERLMEGTKRYFEDVCKGDTKMLKYGQIAAYISTLYNVPVADYDLKKCPELKEYIANLKNSGNKQLLQKNIYFKRLDVDNFLRTNNTAASLKRALVELDSHYEQINEAAECIMEENKRLLAELALLKRENTSLVTVNEKLTANAETGQPNISNMKKKINEQEQRIKTLVRIIEDNVYPEIANELLAETGFVKISNPIISETGKANIMHDTDSVTDIMSKDLISGKCNFSDSAHKDDDICNLIHDLTDF